MDDGPPGLTSVVSTSLGTGVVEDGSEVSSSCITAVDASAVSLVAFGSDFLVFSILGLS